MSLKVSRKSHQKWGPKMIQNEIAGLRHFLPRRHFFEFFLSFFCIAFWQTLGHFWAAFGIFEPLLGVLCCKKRVKTQVCLRFLQFFFSVHFVPLWVILVFLVNLCWILCKNPGPFCVSLLTFFGSYVGLCSLQHKKNKKKNMDNFWFLF